MKQKLLLSLLVLFTATIAWADVEINEENFPDEIFRSFLLEQGYGSDGVLTDAEIAGVASIDVNSKDIRSLKGIEFFTALTDLACNENQLTALDVSQLTALKKLGCSANQLTELDVSKLTALTFLSCSNNQLTELDVSLLSALDTLNCWSNQFTSLDVSRNTALDYLDCGFNQLTSLDISNNPGLVTLYCDYNQLTVIDVSKQTALDELFCDNNQLTSLDVSQNTALTTLLCSDNQLTSLDVSKNTELYLLGCYQNLFYGESMDALVESLPTVTESYLYVLYYENEENVMTAKQAAAAKAKGWLPLVSIGLDDEGNGIWEEYKGGDGIDAPLNDKEQMINDNAVYDLSGRRVQKPGRGLYIVDGKKVLLK